MAFTSFHFLLFFPLVAIVFYALPYTARRVFLLAAGYYFYMCFKPEYVIILAASTLIDYWLGLRMENGRPQAVRKRYFILGIIHNIGMLAALKYLDFFNESIAALLKPFNIVYNVKGFELLLPVGISYYTFKKLSYLLDVYRETRDPEKRLVGFALYVSFFPAITAGPIDRSHSLIPQFYEKKGFDYRGVTEGLKLMAWGFFKKLVIADRLAAFVNKVYDSPTQHEGLTLIVATIYFSFQIYCDFSGYTDIAVGMGRVLGFRLMENFDRPYFSKSIVEFWKRWHISLSSWLMDYLFLPIAYAVSRRIKNPKLLKVKAETWSYMLGMMITFVLCGLWHGASWTFVLWGTVHGLYLAISFATKKKRKRIAKKLKLKKTSFIRQTFQMTVTFGMVTFAWIFFRADSLSDAYYIVTHLFTGWSKAFTLSGLLQSIHFGMLKKELAVALVSLAAMLLLHILRKKDSFEDFIAKRHIVLRWSFYVVLLLWILTFGDASTENFIYFQF